MNSYTSENMLLIHKPKNQNYEATTIKLQENHIFMGKNIFIKNQYFFRIFADFGAENEIDNSNRGNKTTNVYMSKMQCLLVILLNRVRRCFF